MKKIKIISILACVMAVTISVGFTSCSKDKDVVEVDKSHLIQKKWFNTLQGYRIEFRANSTYSYDHSKFGSGNGNYRISEIIEDQELLFSNGEVFNTTLFKILANGSDVFYEIWVYYAVGLPSENIAVEFYSNKGLLQDDMKFYAIDRD